jgi:hypothetical protein
MDLSAVGRDASTTIAGGAYQMWMDGQEIIAVLIAFCAVDRSGSLSAANAHLAACGTAYASRIGLPDIALGSPLPDVSMLES